MSRDAVPFEEVLWIRICFSADPDPAFFVNGDPDADPDLEF